MKKNKSIYWITTSLISLFMIYSAYGYMTSAEMKGAFVHLGFPNYFRIELAIAKIFGAFALFIPAIPFKIKEAAYWGFGFTFISAFIAHFSLGDPLAYAIMPLLFLSVLSISYLYFLKNKI